MQAKSHTHSGFSLWLLMERWLMNLSTLVHTAQNRKLISLQTWVIVVIVVLHHSVIRTCQTTCVYPTGSVQCWLFLVGHFTKNSSLECHMPSAVDNLTWWTWNLWVTMMHASSLMPGKDVYNGNVLSTHCGEDEKTICSAQCTSSSVTPVQQCPYSAPRILMLKYVKYAYALRVNVISMRDRVLYTYFAPLAHTRFGFFLVLSAEATRTKNQAQQLCIT